MITDFFPSGYPPSTLSTRRRAPLLPPRQVLGSAAATPSSALSQTPCGAGYPPCGPGVECVDTFVHGIGFARKRSYCAAGPAVIAGGSVVGDADVPPSTTPDDNNDLLPSSPTDTPPTDSLWPDPAWPGPITTLAPLFGPGPVGITPQPPPQPAPPSSSSSPDDPSTSLTPIAPLPAPLPLQTWTPLTITTTDDPTAAPGPGPAPLTLQCGGPAAAPCPDGLTCVRDLAAPGPLGGCGPACGEVGVCIVPEGCGGLAGRSCSEPGRTCVDQPGDGCDPAAGGADCVGICV
ncbi:uncharacterized protein LTHEOB_11278 [Neofusicoccum parvum]|uniref:Uncharacterized protein LTHEOB_11278 n=1 Tax=Neofusicoccum parvum TaxID=310453 RepID=A0ACB5RQB8_9PEZI|nr:uncharacterized protein LTHEOB_11278 [Neofusicoccum parvum]